MYVVGDLIVPFTRHDSFTLVMKYLASSVPVLSYPEGKLMPLSLMFTAAICKHEQKTLLILLLATPTLVESELTRESNYKLERVVPADS